MRTFFNIIILILLFGIIILIGKNWNKISAWWKRPKDGDKCIISLEPAYLEGIFKDGKCVSASEPETENNSENPPVSGNPPTEQNDLEVSNPNGAYMYYQSISQASQGIIYGKSNVLIPYGTKLKLVKTWQTNLSTQPFSGYYETTYKDYGPNSGFFSTEDVAKF